MTLYFLIGVIYIQLYYYVNIEVLYQSIICLVVILLQELPTFTTSCIINMMYFCN